MVNKPCCITIGCEIDKTYRKNNLIISKSTDLHAKIPPLGVYPTETLALMQNEAHPPVEK